MKLEDLITPSTSNTYGWERIIMVPKLLWRVLQSDVQEFLRDRATLRIVHPVFAFTLDIGSRSNTMTQPK